MLQTRPQLSKKLTGKDVVLLLDCFQGEHFHPDQFNIIPPLFCDHLTLNLMTMS